MRIFFQGYCIAPVYDRATTVERQCAHRASTPNGYCRKHDPGLQALRSAATAELLREVERRGDGASRDPS